MDPVRWENGAVVLIDQRALPRDTLYITTRDYRVVIDAIRTLAVRGAPSIGIAGAYGLALAAETSTASDPEALLRELEDVKDEIAASRPTAVNLSWALGHVMSQVNNDFDLTVSQLKAVVLDAAEALAEKEKAAGRSIGEAGHHLIEDGDNVLTYCNAGPLATGGYGTALGVIQSAASSGKRIHVYVCETRPLLQGARLTVWELEEAGIPHTLMVDAAVGRLMELGSVQKVVVGADRIAANGDTANKVGTYMAAVLAKEHGIPFYVAAPSSTIDAGTATGLAIPVEERDPDEVRMCGGNRVTLPDTPVFNPAFDVTPASLISAFITERGVIYPPFQGLVGA